jgi:thiosulfate/3-mercaptopyruvate sulfurtransferase
LTRWGVTHASQVVAYDAANSSIAARLWWLLRWIGHRAVAVLDGGYQAWTSAGGAVEVGELPGGVAGNAELFHPRPGAEPTVSTAELEGFLPGDLLIVDARAAERYAGRV